MFPRAATGRKLGDNRLIFNAILWSARIRAEWAGIPERYGPHQTAYSRFCKWIDDGTLPCIFQKINKDVDIENLSIDSISVKADPQSAGAKKGL